VGIQDLPIHSEDPYPVRLTNRGAPQPTTVGNLLNLLPKSRHDGLDIIRRLKNVFRHDLPLGTQL
jgi:hypothetical protein